MAVKAGPWGGRPPRKPKVGAGRTALKKRARPAPARGARRTARSGDRTRTEAIRRGLSRGRRSGGRGKRFGRPIRGAAQGLMRFYGLFEQKFLIRQRLRTIILTLAGAWALWTFGIGDAGILRLLHVKQQNGRLAREIGELQREEERLQEEVQALRRSDPVKLEHVARENHAMVKDGEVLVRFYDGEAEEE